MMLWGMFWLSLSWALNVYTYIAEPVYINIRQVLDCEAQITTYYMIFLIKFICPDYKRQLAQDLAFDWLENQTW